MTRILNSLTASSTTEWDYLILVKEKELRTLRELYEDWQYHQPRTIQRTSSTATAPAPAINNSHAARRQRIKQYFAEHPHTTTDSDIAAATNTSRPLVAIIRAELKIAPCSRGGRRYTKREPRQKAPAWGRYTRTPNGLVENYSSLMDE